ncbi:MAG TPA: hypothetical protein RMG95_06090, partial [Polyangiaceae bacterium LLY-WYZ-15_(1-7)]|nr:hypothetical protein [Polyangiaceae bacterium LLY-WYZ-15_(1-7)]
PAPQPTPAPPQAAPAPAPSAPAPSAPAPSAPAPSAGQASGGDDFGLDQEPAEPQTNAPPPMRPKVGGGAKPATATVAEPPNGLAAVMAALEGQLDGLDDVSASRLDDPSRWAAAKKAIDAVVADLADVDADPDLANAALREAVGLGAFEGLLADEGIQEIVVEGPSKVLVDRGQGLVPSEAGFSSARMLTVIARRLAGRSGEAGAGPVLQAMLPEGAHAMIVLPPVAVGGPIVEIRRSGGSSLEWLVARGLPEDAASLLGKAVEAGQSVAVVGQKGAPEVLAAIASSVDPSERVVAVGAVGPIDLPHVVHLAAGGLAGASLGAVALQASAMRADHLVVDGPVDGSCFDAFAAVASHGGGGFLGVRMPASQDPGAALVFAGRLAGKASEAAVAALVAQAVQVVVQVEDGAVVGIHEITGVEDGQVSTQPLFLFQGGSLVSTGASPSF